MPLPEEQFLTTADLARRWNVTRSFVYLLVRNGVLPSVRLGKREIRFRASDIEAFEQRRRKEVAP